MILLHEDGATQWAHEIVAGDVPGGPSTSQTIMVPSLQRLFAVVPPGAPPAAYRDAVRSDNVLGKATAGGREWAFRQLRRFYALDPQALLFRALRDLWADDEIGGLRQEDHPDYPLNAVRELVLNAVTHRDYEHFNAPVRVLWFDDRVEITSPGGPYGVVTKDTFDQRNDYRNPALAAAMKNLGYVNRFGRGIALVRGSLEQNGNPPAEFLVEDNYWSVTVWRGS